MSPPVARPIPISPGPAEQAKMVGWYDPAQLARTGVKVFESTLFGRHADFRLIEALETPVDAAPFYDHTCQWVDGPGDTEHPDPTRPRNAIWIDYVADVGDGWNSTYGIASLLAQPRLVIAAPGDGVRHETRRGELLVFGGDEVYPTASRAEYQARLVGPYGTALPSTPGSRHPHVFAVPGNHDWYDSLVAFTRLFCMKRWFAGWRTQQSRSYFAVKLPHGWWLLGTDVQLGSDVDAPQVEYFRQVKAQMAAGDRVILCNAEPHWIYSKMYSDYDATIYNEGNLAFLEKQILRDRKVSVFLAGDLHHYRRHEAEDHCQKITAGGGGAFLHPTHGPDVSAIEDKDERGRPTGRTFRLKKSWPAEATSRRLCWRNLGFPAINPWFGFVPAALYAMFCWTLMVDVSGFDDFWRVLTAVLARAVLRPASVFWALVVVGGFVLFTDTHSVRYRWIAGIIHGSAHLLAAGLLGWGATYLTVRLLCLEFGGVSQVIVAGLLILVAGWLVSGVIMGVYLLVSLNLFGRHSNEAFSSLRIEDWKQFLRLRIDDNGGLTIYPIGLERVPANGAALTPILIEDPIAV